MLTYADALNAIKTLPNLSVREDVGIDAALGFRLAQDLRAMVPSPAFDNSAMDGFCWKWGEVQPGTPLSIEAEIFAGPEARPVPHTPGHVCRIMTGAALPRWADTVIPVERTTFDEASGKVVFNTLPPEGANVRRRGEDIKEGDLLFHAGAWLNAEALMVAANFGHAQLPVEKCPPAYVFTTGDELVPPGDNLQPGLVYNCSASFLRAALADVGVRPAQVASLPDRPSMAARSLAPLIDQPAVIITTGAVSAGDLDFVPETAEQLGFEVLFHKLAIRPGKPIFMAKKGSCVWLGLPGNPISTAVTWHFVGRALLHQIAGIPLPRKIRAPLAKQVQKPAGLRCFWRAVLENGVLTPLSGQGSAHFLATLKANTYIELPEEPDVVEQGALVDALIIPHPDAMSL
jgi:molybdopterin molybdotransferase